MGATRGAGGGDTWLTIGAVIGLSFFAMPGLLDVEAMGGLLVPPGTLPLGGLAWGTSVLPRAFSLTLLSSGPLTCLVDSGGSFAPATGLVGCFLLGSLLRPSSSLFFAGSFPAWGIKPSEHFSMGWLLPQLLQLSLIAMAEPAVLGGGGVAPPAPMLFTMPVM